MRYNQSEIPLFYLLLLSGQFVFICGTLNKKIFLYYLISRNLTVLMIFFKNLLDIFLRSNLTIVGIKFPMTIDSTVLQMKVCELLNLLKLNLYKYREHW